MLVEERRVEVGEAFRLEAEQRFPLLPLPCFPLLLHNFVEQIDVPLVHFLPELF